MRVTTDDRYYRDIAEALRAKTESSVRYRPGEMAAAIASISGGSSVAAFAHVFVPQGAEVTMTDGKTVLTAAADASGKAVFALPELGSWVYSARWEGMQSDVATLAATEYGRQYNVTPVFMSILVHAPVGALLTVTNGSQTFHGTAEDGTKRFVLRNTGVWSIHAEMPDGSEPSDAVVNVTESREYSVTVSTYKVFGVSWDQSASTRLSRTDAAAGFADPVAYMPGLSGGSSPFDRFYPWNKMRIIEDAEAGRLVEIPRYWYKLERTDAALTLQIANEPTAGFLVSPAHADRGDGHGEREVVYIGRYNCSANSWKSISGDLPRKSVTRSAARSGIHDLGAQVWQMDMLLRQTIQMLYLVEYADWDSQAVIGQGGGNKTIVEEVGTTDAMPYHTGTMQANRGAGVGVQYRHIEGLWSNVRYWVDGCYYSSQGVSVIKNPALFSDTTGGVLIGKPVTGFPRALGVSAVSGFEGLWYPITNGGSNATYVPDNWQYNTDPCVAGGGGFSQSTSFGLFYTVAYTATGVQAFLGCRLMKLP